eukprot:5400643-Karenia_brevis.AAC.1
MAWYLTGASMSYKAVPVIADTAMQGMEDVVDEVVQGSRIIVRCTSIGAMFVAAIVVVQVGTLVLSWLGIKLARATPTKK